MKNLVQKEFLLVDAVTAYHVVLTVCIVLVLFIFGNASAYAQNTICHTVRFGETLTSIAARYGTSVNVIVRNTGISNPNSIRVGQQVCFVTSSVDVDVVATVPSVTSLPAATTTPVPVEGATLSTAPTQSSEGRPIEARATPAATAAVRVLSTPTVAPTLSTTSYIVRRGDSLFRISRLYGVSVSQLMAYNGLNSTTIYTGQTIRIPSR